MALISEPSDQLRRRINATKYRSQKLRRKKRKAELIEARGGRCQDCGYLACVTALEFHHRDASSKRFAVGDFSGSLTRLLAEVEGCDLLCANCHRSRHAREAVQHQGHPVVEHRRRRKRQAVVYMGRTCFACGFEGLAAVFEFHHLDPAQKEFGITQDGIPHRWDKVVAELAKCVMLCANCHREVHAGVRELFDDGLLGLAEEQTPYAA